MAHRHIIQGRIIVRIGGQNLLQNSLSPDKIPFIDIFHHRYDQSPAICLCIQGRRDGKTQAKKSSIYVISYSHQKKVVQKHTKITLYFGKNAELWEKCVQNATIRAPSASFRTHD